MSVPISQDVSPLVRPAPATSQRKGLLSQMWESRWCYLFMIPSLVMTALFTLYPIIASWYFSLFQWSGFTSEPFFIGFQNYTQVVQDGQFWNAFRNSFVFMFASVPIKLSLALLIAIILNDAALRLAPVLRTLFFIPVVTTTAIIGIVMTFIFSPFNGPINMVLLNTGLVNRPIDFLGQPGSALFTVVAVEIWKWMGQPMIYWLAALQTISPTLYEAAKVDGANGWQQFIHITAPLLRPFAIVIILITAVGTLHVFALLQTMTGGGPFFASEVMEVYIYRTAFGAANSTTLPRIGYASAAAVFFGLSVMIFALMQALAARRVNRFRAEVGTGE